MAKAKVNTRIFVFVAVIFLSLKVFANTKDPLPLIPHASYEAVVTKNSDGDTIRAKIFSFNKVVTVRLLNIDAPETHFQEHSQGELGELAAARLAELLPLGSHIKIELDEKPTDLYGRVLGYIRKNNKDINLQMLKEGFALPLFFAPNLSRAREYRETGSRAQQAGRGPFWGEHALQAPSEFRFEKSGRPEAAWVGSLQTGRVISYTERAQIPLLDRVFFHKIEDIQEPFYIFDF